MTHNACLDVGLYDAINIDYWNHDENSFLSNVQKYYTLQHRWPAKAKQDFSFHFQRCKMDSNRDTVHGVNARSIIIHSSLAAPIFSLTYPQ